MPKASDKITTSPSAVEEMAAVPFEALDAGAMGPPPTLAAFMESAGGTFNVIRLGFAMLARTPDELVESFRVVGDGDLLQFASDVSETKAWIAGITQFLEAVEARTWIAACRLAVEG